MHGEQVGLDAMWAELATMTRPQGIGPVLAVDTSREVSARDVGRLALSVRATFA